MKRLGKAAAISDTISFNLQVSPGATSPFFVPGPIYFMLAPPLSGWLETGTPLMPFSPGWLLPLSMPTVVEPESDATGASPGALLSVLPGALSAPVPCAEFR